jgi:uncharacterized protein (DUF488 family)
VRLYTVGFTKKPAREFFSLVAESGATSLLDVRLNNVSQLAGFTKKQDLDFFSSKVLGIPYRHELLLAPSAAMLSAYRGGDQDWNWYQAQYSALLSERRVEARLDPALLDGACLLCTEPTADRCHRRLAAEYLQDHWGAFDITHL